MPFAVLPTKDAVRDFNELYGYVTVHDSPGKADDVLKEIEKTFSALSEFPERGIYPKELLKLGIREYREIFFKPYRIIYRVMDKAVYVLLLWMAAVTCRPCSSDDY